MRASARKLRREAEAKLGPPRTTLCRCLGCRCLGCRCTASVQVPAGQTTFKRRDLTCKPCHRQQHRHHDGSAYERRSTRPTKAAAA